MSRFLDLVLEKKLMTLKGIKIFRSDIYSEKNHFSPLSTRTAGLFLLS
jgi:hypothetical protein